MKATKLNTDRYGIQISALKEQNAKFRLTLEGKLNGLFDQIRTNNPVRNQEATQQDLLDCLNKHSINLGKTTSHLKRINVSFKDALAKVQEHLTSSLKILNFIFPRMKKPTLMEKKKCQPFLDLK